MSGLQILFGEWRFYSEQKKAEIVVYINSFYITYENCYIFVNDFYKLVLHFFRYI